MTTALRRIATANPLVLDGLLAAALTAVTVTALVGGAGDAGQSDPLSVGLLLLQTIPLVVRSRWPLAVLAVTYGATFGHILLAFGHGNVNESLGALVALYTVAERCGRRVSVPAAVVIGLSFAAVFLLAGVLPRGLSGLLQTELSVILGWAFGDFSRTRRLVTRLVAERDRLLELERDERAVRAVAVERERIARELHDVVTHHVSVVVIQAGAAQRALEKRPEQARAALAAIESTGREALLDMRRMLGILGEPGADDGALSSSREPMPGLDRLGELVERVRAAGLAVELAIEGERRALEAGVELSAYRIVQEALTNALKYASGAHASVALRYRPETLEVEVRDAGGAPGDRLEPGHAGRGLIGMRERVALFGGRLEHGRTPDGYRVCASLPVTAAAGAAPVAIGSAEAEP